MTMWMVRSLRGYNNTRCSLERPETKKKVERVVFSLKSNKAARSFFLLAHKGKEREIFFICVFSWGEGGASKKEKKGDNLFSF